MVVPFTGSAPPPPRLPAQLMVQFFLRGGCMRSWRGKTPQCSGHHFPGTFERHHLGETMWLSKTQRRVFAQDRMEGPQAGRRWRVWKRAPPQAATSQKVPEASLYKVTPTCGAGVLLLLHFLFHFLHLLLLWQLLQRHIERRVGASLDSSQLLPHPVPMGAAHLPGHPRR